MAGGSGREQNYWPGFVDALSNVILVMIFVTLVFSAAIAFLASKTVKVKVATEVAQQVEVKTAEGIQATADAEQRVASLERLIAALKSENLALKDLLQRRAARAEGQAGLPSRSPESKAPVTITGQGDTVLLSYALGVTSMEDKLFGTLGEALGGYTGADRWEVLLEARTAEASPSEARRLAFYRIAMLRDHLVAKGVASTRIDSVIRDAPAQAGRSEVTIRLRRRS
jgi:hypothetical protein